LRFPEEAEGAGVLAVAAGLVAMEGVEGAGIVAEATEGQGGAGGRAVECGVVFFDFEAQALRFKGPRFA